jgi:glutathione S-transferase
MSKPLLFDVRHSLYCQMARVALDEFGVEYESKYISLEKGDQFAPEFARITPTMTVPVLQLDSNGDHYITESRDILIYAATRGGVKEEIAKRQEGAAILDELFDCDMSTIAWHQIREQLWLLRMMIWFGADKYIMLLRRRMKENPDLREVYMARIDQELDKTTSINKKYTIPPEEAIGHAQGVVDDLAARLASSKSAWIVGGDSITHVDCAAAVWLQWVMWSNAVSTATSTKIQVPDIVHSFFSRMQMRPSFRAAFSEPREQLYVRDQVVGIIGAVQTKVTLVLSVLTTLVLARVVNSSIL